MDIKDVLKVKPPLTNEKKYKSHYLMKNNIIMKHPFRLCVVAPSLSGKSVIVNSLITKQFIKKDGSCYFDILIFISPTIFITDNTYDNVRNLECYDENLVFNEFDSNVEKEIRDILKENDKLIKKKKDNNLRNVPNILLVIDDCASNDKFMKSKFLKDMFFRSRHNNASIIVTSQFYKSIPRNIRVNTSNIIVCDVRQTEKDSLVEEHLPRGLNKKSFTDILEASTEEYNFLHLNYQVKDSKKRLRKNLDEIIIY